MSLGFRQLLSPGIAVAALLSLSGTAAGSPLVAEVFLFSEYSVTRLPSSPTSVTVDATAGVQLQMDPTLPKVSDIKAVDGPQTFQFDGLPTYAGHTGWVDKRREATEDIAGQITAELTEVDDQGVNGVKDEGGKLDGDAQSNVDFYRKGDSLTLAIPTGKSWTQLLIVEDAGLDTLRLEHCSEASCATPTALFDGFGADWKANRRMREQLSTTPGFSGRDNDDAATQDQAWVFLLSEPLQGFFRITYVGNWGGQGLELDFVSGASLALTQAVVPEPSPLYLLGVGVMALYLMRRFGQPGPWAVRTGTSRQS